MQHSNGGNFEEPMSSFFRNVDTRHDPPLDIPVGDGSSQIGSLRARAILVDMEEGPVSETLRDPIGELFEDAEIVTDVSGSGNNW
jgi:tubulin epsilon